MARKEFDQRVNKEMGAPEEECTALIGDDKHEERAVVQKKKSVTKDKEGEQKTGAVKGTDKKGQSKPTPISPIGHAKVKEGSRAKCEPSRNEPTTTGLKDEKKAGSPTEQKDMSQYSSYGTVGTKISVKDFQWLEEYISKLPFFHGFIGRDDLPALLKNSGDFLIRTSVHANKQEVEKKRKNVADYKVLMNLSREKCVRKEKEKEGRTNAVDVGRREFVISVYTCKGEKSRGKHGGLPFRNLVIKREHGMVFLETAKKFKTLSNLLSHYQKHIGTCKEAEFQFLNPVPLSSWEFLHESVELLSKRLGEGAFGEVRVGKLKLKSAKSRLEVAVKMLRNSEVVTREQMRDLLHEARVMRTMDHKNVLKSYGIAVLREPLYLMTEMCSFGALREYLRENHDVVTLADKLAFVLGSARGVEYLHSQKTIHRDLAVRNILLAEDKTPKVSDFGLARVTERYEMREQCRIPVRYLAPETLDHFVFTAKTDVFSFGCVIWEIYENGNQPHDGKNAQTIKNLTKKNQFLKLTNSAPAELRKLVAEKVFTADPENRCSMSAIVQCVEKIEKPPVGAPK